MRIQASRCNTHSCSGWDSYKLREEEYHTQTTNKQVKQPEAADLTFCTCPDKTEWGSKNGRKFLWCQDLRVGKHQHYSNQDRGHIPKHVCRSSRSSPGKRRLRVDHVCHADQGKGREPGSEKCSKKRDHLQSGPKNASYNRIESDILKPLHEVAMSLIIECICTRDKDLAHMWWNKWL